MTAKKREQLKPVIVYSEGLCYVSVCVHNSVPKNAIRNHLRPSGTSLGWRLSRKKKFKDGKSLNGCACNKRPRSRKHYLMEC